MSRSLESSSWYGTGQCCGVPGGRSFHPRESKYHAPYVVYAVSMRFSHFIASMMLPHIVALYPALGLGTRGTQLAPPGTGSSSEEIPAPVNGARPLSARVLSIKAAASSNRPRRM